MKHKLDILIFIICFGLAQEMIFAENLRQIEPVVAIVTSITGQARALREGVETPLSLGQELNEGARIQVLSGAVSIVFLQGDYIELKSGESLTLGSDLTSSKLSNTTGTRGLSEDDAISVAAAGITRMTRKDRLSQLAHISGIRGDKVVIPVSPRLTISDQSPVFYWFDFDSTSAGQNRIYTLIIRDHNNSIILQKDIAGKVLELNSISLEGISATLSPAPEKHFTWGIFIQGTVPSSREKLDASFVYIDPVGLQKAAEQKKKISSLFSERKIDESSYHALLSLYYCDERERLFADAIPHLIWLSSTSAGKQYAETQLMNIFAKFGKEAALVAGFYAQRSAVGTEK